MGASRWRILLVTGVAAAAVQASTCAWAARSHSSDIDFRARLEGLYGWVNYSSVSVVTNANTAINGNEWGGRGELEGWFSRRFGVLVEGELISGALSDSTVGTFKGNPISQGAVAAELAVRLLGNGHADSSEVVVALGPGVEFFSDVRAYVGAPFYDLVHADVLGGRGTVRTRIPLSRTVVLDLRAHAFFPAELLGLSGAQLSSAASHTFGGAAAAEYRFQSGLGVGAGFFFEKNHLEYRALPNIPSSQVIDFNVSAPLVYLRFAL